MRLSIYLRYIDLALFMLLTGKGIYHLTKGNIILGVLDLALGVTFLALFIVRTFRRRL